MFAYKMLQSAVTRTFDMMRWMFPLLQQTEFFFLPYYHYVAELPTCTSKPKRFWQAWKTMKDGGYLRWWREHAKTKMAWRRQRWVRFAEKKDGEWLSMLAAITTVTKIHRTYSSRLLLCLLLNPRPLKKMQIATRVLSYSYLSSVQFWQD